MLLAAPRREVLRVITLTGLIDISDICASIGEAVDIADRVRGVAVA